MALSAAHFITIEDLDQYLEHAVTLPSPWLSEHVKRCFTMLATSRLFTWPQAAPWYRVCAATSDAFLALEDTERISEQLRAAETFYRRSAELLPDRLCAAQLQQLAARCREHNESYEALYDESNQSPSVVAWRRELAALPLLGVPIEGRSESEDEDEA